MAYPHRSFPPSYRIPDDRESFGSSSISTDTAGASDRAGAAAAPRVFAFAKALGLTVEHMVTLLESYDLHLLSGPAMREEIDRSVIERYKDALAEIAACDCHAAERAQAALNG